MDALTETVPACDEGSYTRAWKLCASGREPVDYDPALVPGWDGLAPEASAVLRVDLRRLRVFPGVVLIGQGGTVLCWRP